MKFKKLYLIILIFLMLFLCIGSVSALENQTDDSGENDIISIDESLGNPTDESVDNGMIGDSDDGSFISLKSKIGDASDGSVIYLENNYHFDDSADSEGIIISKSITIYGNNYTIDAQGHGRIFNILRDKTVNLYDITFKNGNSDKGGAIYVAGDFSGNLNATFINNTAMSTGNDKVGGGAIYVEGSVSGNLTGTFENNRASYDYVECSGGGAIYIMNGVSGNLTGTFINNSAKDGCVDSGGGAIYINLGGVSGNLTGTFENNRVDFVGGDNLWVNSGGGAIYINRGNISGNLTGTFVNNTAYADGGAIYTWSGDISGNLTGTFINNAANTRGGAISANYFTFSGNLTGTFVNNTARYGGAIDLGCADSPGTLKNCNFTNNKANNNGGAIYSFCSNRNVENCNFVNNTASYGGAAYFINDCEVTNCNFTNNKANNNGGAIYSFCSNSNVENCNFVNNTASYGGAAYFFNDCEVTNCNFTGNNASAGSAIFFEFEFSTNTISNSCFLNNRANAEALELIKNENKITIAFTGYDNLLNAIYSYGDVTFNNVTYWCANGIANTGSSTPSRSNKEAGQNIAVSVVVNNEIVLSEVYTTDEKGMIVLDMKAGDNYFIGACHNTDSYYTEIANTTSNNTKFNVNVTSQTTTGRTVNITAKSNIPNEVIKGKLLFIVPNTDPINATYAGNGTWWAVHTFDDYSTYEVKATYIGLDNVTVSNATITINKQKTEITAKAITSTYNTNEILVVTLTDINSNPLSGFPLTVEITGIKTYTTDANGQIKISVGKLTPKTYNVKITFGENADYLASSANVKVTVKKAASKITAKKKTFKKSSKVKKYTAVLKSGKTPIKKAKLALKIKGKTYKAKTSKKGKATFKIKLNKKGKYKATIKYKGNKYFKAVTKKVKITIK